MKPISDTAIKNIVGIPITTLQDWKKKEKNDYRRVLYDALKKMSEEEIKEWIKA